MADSATAHFNSKLEDVLRLEFDGEYGALHRESAAEAGSVAPSSIDRKRPPPPPSSPQLDSKRRKTETFGNDSTSSGHPSPASAPIGSSSSVPPKMKTPRIRTRHKEYLAAPETQAKRDAYRKARGEERFATRVQPRHERAVNTVPLSLSNLPSRGEFVGKGISSRGGDVGDGGERDDAVRATGEWPLTSSASAVDASGKFLMLYRAHGSYEVIAHHLAVVRAVQELVAATRAEFSAKVNAHKRGKFPSRSMQIHRTQCNDPVHNKWMTNNLPHVLRFADRLKPVISFISRIFARRFPRHFDFYDRMMKELASHPSLKGKIHNLFGPFASCCVNTGGRVQAVHHTDTDNYFAGFCTIFPLGWFDYRASARLVIDLGNGFERSYELPMGIPFFLPSAIVAHYNTRIVHSGDVRGSLVFWTSGKLFQWLALGGRAWGALSSAEQNAFLEGKEARLAEAIGRYPVFL